jgi:Pheromone A receptor
MCWLLPAVYMALRRSIIVSRLLDVTTINSTDYIVQGHRFDIVEDIGCLANTYISIPGILIIWVPPMIIVTLTIVASCKQRCDSSRSNPYLTALSDMALHNFFQRRITFSKHLRDVNSALTTSRYVRLMLMSLVQIIWGLIVAACNVGFSLRNGLRPWTGFADVHWDFSRIAVYPFFVMTRYEMIFTLALWWAVPISALLFFAFFSFGEDAMKDYRATIAWVRQKVLPCRSHQATASSGSQFTIAQYVCPLAFHLLAYVTVTAPRYNVCHPQDIPTAIPPTANMTLNTTKGAFPSLLRSVVNQSPLSSTKTPSPAQTQIARHISLIWPNYPHALFISTKWLDDHTFSLSLCLRCICSVNPFVSFTSSF